MAHYRVTIASFVNAVITECWYYFTVFGKSLPLPDPPPPHPPPPPPPPPTSPHFSLQGYRLSMAHTVAQPQPICTQSTLNTVTVFSGKELIDVTIPPLFQSSRVQGTGCRWHSYFWPTSVLLPLSELVFSCTLFHNQTVSGHQVSYLQLNSHQGYRL